MKNLFKYFLLPGILMMKGLSLFSQQGNNWYFGNNAGISFNSSPPAALLNGSLNTFEGCASLSNNSGLLLFYTDGINIWNRNHQTMPNGTGLKGDPSSSNSAIIIPKPGSDSIYYIFTADAGENDNIKGYNYSEVDMTLDGGLGDVTSNKNVLLYAPSTEKLTAVRHANGMDIWVVTHAWGNNAWFAYKIDCNGVNTVPVQSNAGRLYTDTVLFNNGNGPKFIHEGSVGCLKASPDGRKIATTGATAVNWEIFNFDNANGTLSGALLVPNFTAYGIEFSPDSKLVYVASERWGYPYSFITQYNLNVFDSASVTSSGIRIGISEINPNFLLLGAIGALQIGPDNKIYCAIEQTSALAVINSPNTPGLSCNFVTQQVDLGERICQRGLPVFLPGLITNQNASFTFLVNNDCSTVNFSGNATISGTLNWDWDFGDGTTGTGQNVTHSFPPGAIDTVKLIVTTSTSCGTAKAIAVKPLNLTRITPVSAFGFSIKCGNPLATFTDSSTVPISTIQNWSWDFGDGVISTAQNPSHTYPTFGNYTVKLTVASAGTCNGSDVSQKIISVEPKPVAGFSVSNACARAPVDFTDNSTIAAGTITKWYWNLDDNQTSAVQNPKNKYNSAKDYIVKLVATSSTGCVSDTIIKTIHVNANPVALFFANDGCENQVTSFTNNSSITDGSVDQWNWVFGNGNTSIMQSPSTTFPAYGNYTIKLTVSSDKNCKSDTAMKTIAIEPKPIADFSAPNGCAGKTLTILDKSTISFGSVGTYSWDFGNGSNSNQESPGLTYTSSGNFTIKEVVVSKNGCTSDTAYQTVNIESIPKVDFSFGSTCAGKPISFTNISSNENDSTINWIWDFGTNDRSALFEPAYTYKKFGNYHISLEASTQNGCKASTSKTISIKKIDVFAGYDTIVSINQPLQLFASGAKDYTWSSSQHLDNPSSDHPIATLPQSQTYFLSGVTAEGCIGYDTINIKVYKGPEIYVPNAFTPNSDGTNDVFRPILPGIKELLYFSVYNRWGQLIFSTKEIGKGWDGKLKGIDQPGGGFVWMLKVITFQGNIIERKGSVFLIK